MPPLFAVALFDVLGFESLVRSQGLAEIRRKYKALIEQAVAVPDGRFLNLVGGAMVLGYMQNTTSHAYFSDTILIWQPLDRILAQPFVSRCADMVATALEMDMPLRGALALGPAELDKEANVYLGEPIIEAARLESQQDWVGVAFAASAMWPQWMAEMSTHDVVPYRIPLKTETSRADLCGAFALNWCRRLKGKAVPMLEVLREKLPATATGIRQKYDNTIAFVHAAEEWLVHVERDNLHGFHMVTPEEVECNGIKDPLILE
jgi:hypothetical protein